MEADASGYEIKQKLEKLFSHFYNASYGTIYPTLGHMEKEGLITKRSLVQEGKPNKNIYSVTDKGRRQFQSYLASDIQEVEIKSDIMVRLYFGGFADPGLAEHWLETSIKKTELSLAKLSGEYARWESKLNPTQRICMRIGVTNTENILRNLKEGLALIRGNPEA